MGEYVDLQGLSAREIAEKLTLGLCEVEHVEEVGHPFEGVVAGEILDVAPHPDAQRLRLARVRVSEEAEALQIVCGAPNIATGQRVPVALPGAKLPGEKPGEKFKIKKSKIRGQVSFGMMCSEKELGLSDDHEGIYQLPLDTPLGRSLTEFLDREGEVLVVDNKSLTHRSDCWGLLGLARELGALLQRPFKTYQDLSLAEDVEKIPEFPISIDEKGLCFRYHALKVSNLKVKASPKSWAKKLESLGLKSINNIVDATNLVLFEYGQPLHAFDAEKVKERLRVRRAREGETFRALDGQDYRLETADLVIADDEAVLALAGVMGAETSAVSDGTTAIYLEGANFEALTVRRTSHRLGLRSDSSARFEKGLSPFLVGWGLKRCLSLLRESCPDLKVETGFREPAMNSRCLDLSLSFVKACLGVEIPKERIKKNLESLGFELQENGKTFQVTLPLWRSEKDISQAVDLVEEIGRLEGYSKWEAALPKSFIEPARVPAEKKLEKRLRHLLAGPLACQEVLSYAFSSERKRRQLGLEKSLFELENPVNKDHRFLRSTLLEGLLEALEINHRREENIHVFEIGRVFLEGETDFFPLQKRCVAGLHCQKEGAFHVGKEVLESLLATCDIFTFKWRKASSPPPWAHPGKVAELLVQEGKKFHSLCCLAAIHPKFIQEMDVIQEVFFWELSLEDLQKLPQKKRRFRSLPRYPESFRDLSLLVDEGVSVDEVMQLIRKGSRCLKNLELFDIYRGKGLEKGKKSLSFHLVFQDEKKTLSDEDVDREEAALMKRIEEKNWQRR
jgi:phenylalanyl-tRNA synthetase beta chain